MSTPSTSTTRRTRPVREAVIVLVKYNCVRYLLVRDRGDGTWDVFSGWRHLPRKADCGMMIRIHGIDAFLQEYPMKGERGWERVPKADVARYRREWQKNCRAQNYHDGPFIRPAKIVQQEVPAWLL